MHLFVCDIDSLKTCYASKASLMFLKQVYFECMKCILSLGFFFFSYRDQGQLSGPVLVYRNPGTHPGDIHVLNARYVEALKDFVGSSKYGIFFPSKGARSTGDEIAGGDYDGDTYWVSTNSEVGTCILFLLFCYFYLVFPHE